MIIFCTRFQVSSFLQWIVHAIEILTILAHCKIFKRTRGDGTAPVENKQTAGWLGRRRRRTSLQCAPAGRRGAAPRSRERSGSGGGAGLHFWSDWLVFSLTARAPIVNEVPRQTRMNPGPWDLSDVSKVESLNENTLYIGTMHAWRRWSCYCK